MSEKAGFRFRDGGWEGKCQTCREWLPLDNEFWPTYDGAAWGRCRPCLREYKSRFARERKARRTPEQADDERAALRLVMAVKRPLTREARREAGRRHYAAHREEVRARARARFAALPESEKARIRAKNRDDQRRRRAAKRSAAMAEAVA